MNCFSCASHTRHCLSRNIPVVFWNGAYGVVKDFVLDELIFRAEIKKFYREGGWAVLGCHPIRISEKAGRVAFDRRGISDPFEDEGEVSLTDRGMC